MNTVIDDDKMREQIWQSLRQDPQRTARTLLTHLKWASEGIWPNEVIDSTQLKCIHPLISLALRRLEAGGTER